MNDIPGDEARALLAQPLLCEDGDWRPSPIVPDVYHFGCGLIDPTGSRTSLVVDMNIKQSHKTGVREYVMTIRRLRPLACRVYQLQIKQWPKKFIDPHNMPHEHMGADEADGPAEWLTYSFDQVLAVFTDRTNITFIPPLQNPFDFKLVKS